MFWAHETRFAGVSGRTTALILAAGYGQADIVGILLDHRANPRITAPDGKTALMAAAVEGSNDFEESTAGKCQTSTVRALLAHDPELCLAADSEALKRATQSGCEEILTLVRR